MKQSKNLKIKPKDDEERLFLDFNVHIFSHIIYLLYPKYDADVSRMCIQLCVLHCVTLSPADDAECQLSPSVNQMPMSCQHGYSTNLLIVFHYIFGYLATKPIPPTRVRSTRKQQLISPRSKLLLYCNICSVRYHPTVHRVNLADAGRE